MIPSRLFKSASIVVLIAGSAGASYLAMGRGLLPGTTRAPSAVAAIPGIDGVQRALYVGDFQNFVAQLKVAAPQFKLTDAALAPPAYDPGASRSDWVTAFEAAVASQNHLSPEQTQALVAEGNKMSLGYSNNLPYGKVSYLQLLPDADSTVAPQIQSIEKMALLAQYPSPHTMDLGVYVSQRFAAPVQDFIKKNRIPLFGHDSSCAEAIAYHRSQGFTEVAQYASQVDDPNPPNFIAYNPKTGAYAFGVCDLIGNDDVTRIAEIVGPIFKDNGGFIVHHSKPEALVTFNAAGSAFAFHPNDRVIMGYQNTVWWQLYTSASGADWTRSPLSSAGLETDLFENSKTGERIVSVANCYGDEMKMALDIFWAKGARRFAYLGTAGGFGKSLSIGDVLLPTRFRFKPTGSNAAQVVELKNSATQMGLKIPAGSQLIPNSQQDWVSTLVEESIANVDSMRDAGSQAMDVEARYIAEFFAAHAATEATVIILVSDLPLTTETYVEAGAHRDIDMNNVNAIVPQLLGWTPGK